MSGEQKRQRLIAARQHVRHCLRLNLPEELSGLYVIMDGAALHWKIHEFIEQVTSKWDGLRVGL